MKTTTEVIVGLIVVATIITFFLALSDKRDEKIMKAADLYEECVRQEYGVSPSYWYQEHGEYPTCPKN